MKQTWSIIQTVEYKVTLDVDKGLHECYLGSVKAAVTDHVLGNYNSEMVAMEWSEPEHA